MDDDDEEHELTVESGGGIYYVRAIKRTDFFLDHIGGADGPVGLVVEIVLYLLWQSTVVLATKAWKVGVVADPMSDWAAERVVFKERLPRDHDVDAELVRLAALVEASRLRGAKGKLFRPTTYRSSRRDYPQLLVGAPTDVG